MAVFFLTIIANFIAVYNLREVIIPILYDHSSEMIYFIASIGKNTTSFLYPISISSQFSVLYTFGKDTFNSSTLIVTQNIIYQSSNNLTGALASDNLHIGEYLCVNFEFVYNTDKSPVNWRSFKGILSLSRSVYAFHNQLQREGIINHRVIEYAKDNKLRIGGYEASRPQGTCDTVPNGNYWSCSFLGFGIGEVGYRSKTIDTRLYRNYLSINGIVSFHSMERDITVPYEYLEWFKLNYFGMIDRNEMKDGCNEVEDEDSLGNVIFKISCFNKLETTYKAITFFIGKDLAITIPAKETFNAVQLMERTVHVFKIQFKEKLTEWNFGWRLMKNNFAVLNDDNNTIGLALGDNVFIAEPIVPQGQQILVKILAYVGISELLIGVVLLIVLKSSSLGKDYSNLITNLT